MKQERYNQLIKNNRVAIDISLVMVDCVNNLLSISRIEGGRKTDALVS